MNGTRTAGQMTTEAQKLLDAPVPLGELVGMDSKWWSVGLSVTSVPRALCTAMLAIALGCAAPSAGTVPVMLPPRPVPAPVPAAVLAPALPPVPRMTGAPLDPRVRYPSENQSIAVRDSNFILGSVGTGDASLTINGVPVDVAPNGAFIGWLPVPPSSSPRYDLVVVRGADTARRSLRIRVPARVPLPATGPLRVDSASLVPAARQRLGARDAVRVSVRAPRNAQVWLQRTTAGSAPVPGSDTSRMPLVPLVVTQGVVSRAAHGRDGGPPSSVTAFTATDLSTNGAPDTADVSSTFSTDVPAFRLAQGLTLVAVRGADTVRLRPVPPQLMDSLTHAVGVLRAAAAFESDTDRVVIARPIPDGTYKWMLLPGTTLEITGRQGDFTRVRLDAALDVWVANADIVPLPDGASLPRRVTAGMRVVPSAQWVDVVIPMGERPAFIAEPAGNTLGITLYGVQANPEISPILANDTLVRQISWDQVATDRVRLELRLSSPVYGWLVQWDENRRALVVRVRRPPVINVARPLAGLTIVVDPGHPPIGATGPTGLYEGDAVLPVGVIVAELLKAKGANAVLTRTTLAPVGLTERNVIARRANANAFVSIHLNAFGDGTNPFTNNGTSTLFFHQHSEPLARTVQREVMARFGLRDLGVHYQNLAVARPTWYPAVLCEGLFVIMPEQEAAMRDPGFQRRYAEGLVAGIEDYFRALAQH